jgi:hypothetical protein
MSVAEFTAGVCNGSQVHRFEQRSGVPERFRMNVTGNSIRGRTIMRFVLLSSRTVVWHTLLMTLLMNGSSSGAESNSWVTSSPDVKLVNGGVEISFQLTKAGDITVEIADAKGTVVRRVVAGAIRESAPPPKTYFGGFKAGTYLGPPQPLVTGLKQKIIWDMKDDAGARVPGGKYTVAVRAGLKGTLDPAWKPQLTLKDPGLQLPGVSHPLVNIDPVTEDIYVLDELGTKQWKVAQDGAAVQVPTPKDCVESVTYFGNDGLIYKWEIKPSAIHEGKKKPSELAAGDASVLSLSRYDRQTKPVPFASTGSHVLPLCESRVSAGGPPHPLYRGMLVDKDGTITIFRIFHPKQLHKWDNPGAQFPCWVEEIKVGQAPVPKGWSKDDADFKRYKDLETSKRMKIDLAHRPGFVLKDLEVSVAPGMDLLTIDAEGRVKSFNYVDMGMNKPRLGAKNIPWGILKDKEGYFWVQQSDFSPFGLRKLKLPPCGELLVPEKSEKSWYWSLVMGGGDQMYCKCRQPVMHQAMDPHSRLYLIKNGPQHDCFGKGAAAVTVRDQMGNVITEIGTTLEVLPGVKKDGEKDGHGEFPWSAVALNSQGTRMYALERFGKRLIRFNLEYAEEKHAEINLPAAK